ncbi:MAG: chromosomal replication initiator protein DnaA, partial [Candidatus Omnitrophota bacterium]
MNLLEAWQQTTQILKERIGTTVFETWFTIMRPEEKNGTLFLEVPDNFFKDWVSNHYSMAIKEIMQQVKGSDVEIEFCVNPNLTETKDKNKFSEFKSRIEERGIEPLKLNPKYTFDNFIVGPSNRFAHAASLAVAESPAKTYNPLFIYGGAGLGKTHLMQAICRYLYQRQPQKYKICYIPSEKFTNELIEAIQHRSTQKFRAKYRAVDLLVIDDIHFIAGKESTQEEFFHTFNTLYDDHKQIIISSDRSPKDISNLEERLISRFSWGLVTDIQPPDFETRVAILKKKIENDPTPIPDDVIFFIANLIKSNIRELEGALIRVIAYALLENKSITLSLAQDVLKDLSKESIKLISPDLIQKYISEEFNISLSDLKNQKRSKNIVLPRQLAMYLIRELTTLSLPEIGEFFGGKDHTTVL